MNRRQAITALIVAPAMGLIPATAYKPLITEQLSGALDHMNVLIANPRYASGSTVIYYYKIKMTFIGKFFNGEFMGISHAPAYDDSRDNDGMAMIIHAAPTKSKGYSDVI